MDKIQLLSAINSSSDNTLVSALGIEITDIEKGYIEGKMPVDHRTHQPMGLLHGGATAALAETLGSFGSHYLIDSETQATVGIEISANHLRGVKSGHVTGKAKIEHQGRKMHVWSIDVFDQDEKKIAVCRLTNMIINK